ncbi:hypothetical protein RDV89_14215 [Nocardioides zeae]|uniref:Uncharacterized protein n=1 Tax=Nocardioides imazamoxiresistens TaxID=3231893 RepID=A0ABU3PYE2_9ACTN|nr:hypothetical protein [Nocardioides zeae]MDT9594234.1 hypothetical protein [Nocardioides zeae]
MRMPDYRHLPEPVRDEELVATVEAEAPPAHDAERNADQHAALRDD